MMTRSLLTAMIFLWLSLSAWANSDVIEELRQGEHFDRELLFGTGPRVLMKALAGDKFSINTLARYIQNGERGFPLDKKVAARLYEAAYRRGNWNSAWALAQIAEADGNYWAAYRYYSVLFLAAREQHEINTRFTRLYSHFIPDHTHLAYAGAQFLERSGAVSQEEILAISSEAEEEAKSRGFWGDCLGMANRQCEALIEADDDGIGRCLSEAQDLCYRDRKKFYSK